MIVALTGTPGVGKSSVGKILKKKNYTVIELAEIADKYDFVSGYDTERNCKIINLKRLDLWVKKNLKNSNRIIFLTGHYAHLIENDLVIVLRCSPKVLERRLKRKRYTKKKIAENLEAEGIGIITAESLSKNRNTYEIDATGGDAKSIADKVIQILKSNKFKGCEAGNIDWSEEIMAWY